MMVAMSSGRTASARRRTCWGSLASACRPRARTSASESVPWTAGSSIWITWRSVRARERTSATLRACASVETKATTAPLSSRS